MAITQRDTRVRRGLRTELLGLSVLKGTETEKLAKENDEELPDRWEKYCGSMMLQKSRRKTFKE